MKKKQLGRNLCTDSMGKKGKRRNQKVGISFETEAHFYIANQSWGTMEIKTKLRSSLQIQHFFMNYVNSNSTWKKKNVLKMLSQKWTHIFLFFSYSTNTKASSAYTTLCLPWLRPLWVASWLLGLLSIYDLQELPPSTRKEKWWEAKHKCISNGHSESAITLAPIQLYMQAVSSRIHVHHKKVHNGFHVLGPKLLLEKHDIWLGNTDWQMLDIT